MKPVAILLVLLIAPWTRAADFSIWTAPATTKILEADAAPKDAKASIELRGARREIVAFQIALRCEQDAPAITAKVGELRGPTNIPADRITIWREHYVPTNVGRKPDPLSPLKTIDLKANVTQPLLVEIDLPHDAPPGEYSAVVSIAENSIPIALHVHDFEIPITPSLRTAFGNNNELIAAFEKIPDHDEVFEKYKRAYWEILLAHRLSPYNVPADLMSPESDAFLKDPRLTSYTIPYDEGKEDDAKLLALCDRLRKLGVFGKGYFYPVDEPHTKEAFDRLDKIAQRLKKLVPDYKMVTPYCANPTFKTDKDIYDYLTGRSNIWCYLTSIHYFRTDKLEARRAAGEEIWNYVCWVPPSPHANFLIDMDAIQHRILFWQEWKYRVSGLLYWSTNFWINNGGGTMDPWRDMATVKWADKNTFGDGSLLYPGAEVKHDGPLPSLRLKLIRQGLQDYEYIKLAADRAGKDKADAIVNEHVKNWTEYERDPVKLDEAKVKLAKLIVESNRH